MTKKDYIKIADILAILRKNQQLVQNMNDKKMGAVAFALYNLTVVKFCEMLQADNPLFDKKRFIAWINK